MSKSNTEDETNKEEIPEEFTKVIYDLTNDILFTFPEYSKKMDADLYNIKETRDDDSVRNVYEHIKKVLPERFFDILYKNEEMFTSENEGSTMEIFTINFIYGDWKIKCRRLVWRHCKII